VDWSGVDWSGLEWIRTDQDGESRLYVARMEMNLRLP
jgi:hypothetical protein